MYPPDTEDVMSDQMSVSHARASMTCEKCLNVSERSMLYCGPTQRISTGSDIWGAVMSDEEIGKLDEGDHKQFCNTLPVEHFHLICPRCHYRWTEGITDAHLSD